MQIRHMSLGQVQDHSRTLKVRRQRILEINGFIVRCNLRLRLEPDGQLHIPFRLARIELTPEEQTELIQAVRVAGYHRGFPAYIRSNITSDLWECERRLRNLRGLPRQQTGRDYAQMSA